MEQNQISIHAPREGSDLLTEHNNISVETISIHAPREGSDREMAMDYRTRNPISIHAPREGSDGFLLVEGFLYPNFYPRSPRGERQPGFFYFNQ